jgi:hypothetical protein
MTPFRWYVVRLSLQAALMALGALTVARPAPPPSVDTHRETRFAAMRGGLRAFLEPAQSHVPAFGEHPG